MRKILQSLLAAAVLTAMGCGNSFSGAQKYLTGPVDGVGLKKSTSIVSLQSEQLYPVVSPSKTANKKVTWKSSDETVATVDDTGRVHAVSAVSHGETKSAVITVTTEEGGFSSSCSVTVVEKPVPVASVSINKSSTYLVVDTPGTEQLTAAIAPSDATNQNLAWSSNASAIVSVDANGLIKAIQKGTGVITVTASSGVTASCSVTVAAAAVPVTDISLNKTSSYIVRGNAERLFSIITPSGATNQNVVWTSSDDAVATVDSTGLVAGVSAGTVTVKAQSLDLTNGTFYKTASIVVVNSAVAVQGITLGSSQSTVSIGTSCTLSASIQPIGATNQNILWKSSNPSVASVDSSGVVTGIAAGDAVVTATTEDGGYSAVCRITVSTQPVYTLTYYAPDADIPSAVPVDNNGFVSNTDVTVKANIGGLTKAGYVLSSWSYSGDKYSAGTVFQPGQIVTIGKANVTLTAQWTQMPTCSVTYDGNGNTGGIVPTDSTRYYSPGHDTVTVLGAGSLVKSGYSFNGWYATSTLYGEGSSFTITTNIILYAQWVINALYAATFNGNGNTDDQSPIMFTDVSGATYTAPSATSFSKTNSVFVSWNTKADGSGTDVSPGTQLSLTSNVIYYAKWKSDPAHSYTIGAAGPGGGTIFYNKGYYSNGWQYMEVAPSDISGTMAWCSGALMGLSGGSWVAGYDPQTGFVTTPNIGEGYENTLNVIEEYSTNHGTPLVATAAVACMNYSNNGKYDWFLPSSGELQEIYNNIGSTGFTTGTSNYYWSSTQKQNSFWYQYSIAFSFKNNNETGFANHYDGYQNYVRPIRRF